MFNDGANNKSNRLPSTDLGQSAHMKHISEISREDQRRAQEILLEIREIFDGIIGLSKDETKYRLENFGKLKVDVEKLGYAITVDIVGSDQLGEMSVKADLRLHTSKCKTNIAN